MIAVYGCGSVLNSETVEANSRSEAKGVVLEPTLHFSVPMGSRVTMPPIYTAGTERTGTVVGIATCHVIFIYIVLLDEPVESAYGRVDAIVVPGPELEGLDGTNWRAK